MTEEIISPSIMLRIIPQIVEKQKQKQQFLEKIFKQCNEEFQKINKQQHLNDDQHQKQKGQIKGFQEELKEEIQNAIKYQDEKNLTQDIMFRLHLEILDDYYQGFNLKRDKIMPSSNKIISLLTKIYQTYFLKFCSIEYTIIVVIVLIIFYCCFQNNQLHEFYLEQGKQIQSLYQVNDEFLLQQKEQDQLVKQIKEQIKEIQSLQQVNHELILEQKEQDKVIKQIKAQINELFEVKDEIHNQRKNQNHRNKLKFLAGEIYQNMDVELLNDFTLIYNKYYTQPLSYVMFDKLQKQLLEYNQDPLICIGSVKVTNQKQMILAGCDFASEIFQITYSIKIARLSKNGPIYWYRVENKSFGFAPTEKINLDLCDSYEPHNDLRLSYWNDGKFGGRRIGKFQNIINSDQFQLRIYALI